MTVYQNITNCNSGKYDMSEGSWGLGFQDTGDGGRWAGPQHGRGQRSASVSSGLLVGGHGWWAPGAMISDVHFEMSSSLTPCELSEVSFIVSLKPQHCLIEDKHSGKICWEAPRIGGIDNPELKKQKQAHSLKYRSRCLCSFSFGWALHVTQCPNF